MERNFIGISIESNNMDVRLPKYNIKRNPIFHVPRPILLAILRESPGNL